MNPNNVVQTVSPFPAPPEYAQFYKNDETEIGGSGALMPPPVQTEFTVFGEEYRLDDEIIRKFLKRCLVWVTEPTFFLLIVQLCLVPLLALFAPLYLRSNLLSTPIHQEILLNLVDRPCADDFRSCPFPIAHLDTDGIFSPLVHYKVSLRMHFAEEEINTRVGIFSNEINIYDDNGKSMGRWRRTGLSKAPEIIYQIIKLILLNSPVRQLVSFMESQNIMEMTLIKDFFYTPNRPAKEITYTLQDHFIHFDEIYLIITAKTGFLAYCFQYWPFVTFAVVFLFIVFVGYAILMLFWFYKAFCYYREYRKQSAVQADPENIGTN